MSNNGSIAEITVPPRVKTGLRPLAGPTPLTPDASELCLDKVALKVSGYWSPAEPGSNREVLFRDYVTHVGSLENEHLFRRPDPWQRKFRRSLRELPRNLTTIAKANFVLIPRDVNENVQVELTANPTRTLRHLIARFSEADDFSALVTALQPQEFFATTDTRQRSLDGSDNWLLRPMVARELLGETDYFGAFLPIWIAQLQSWVERELLWNGQALDALHQDGSTVLLTGPVRLRLDWGATSLQQSEIYFERRTSGAVSRMQKLAHAMLTQTAQCRSLIFNEGSREGPRLSVSAKLSNDRRISIYAKDPRRIRFEVKNLKTSSHRLQRGSLERRLQLVRLSAVRALQWSELEPLLRDVEPVGVDAMIGFLAALVRELRGIDRLRVSDVLTELLLTGGITRTTHTKKLVERLERRGILKVHSIRNRGSSKVQQRYSLAHQFVGIREALLQALVHEPN